jgi:radical SAM superfamily enzyme YgiQ (UPF0313 family)
VTDYTAFVHDNLHRFRRAEAFLPLGNPTYGNPSFQDAPYRVLIVRLSPFHDVDRSLPHLYLYQEARRALPHSYIDMAFFPARIERNLFIEASVPLLLGTQSHHTAADFDLVLLTNAYTLELINLPYLLLHSGIPLFSSQRGAEWPLFVLGGSNASASQAIIRANGDCLMDGIFFGEGEGQVGRLISILAEYRSRASPPPPPRTGGEEKGRAPTEPRTRGTGAHSSLSHVVCTGEGWEGGRLIGTVPIDSGKRQVLARAAKQVEGLWVAGSLAPTTKATCDAPQAQHLPGNYPADEVCPLLNSPEAHTAHLQITYGCPAFCSFCFEAYDRKPYREIPLPVLLDAARRIKRAQGSEEINLYSFNFNTHADILALLPALHQLYDRVSATSQRVDILQHTPALLEAELAADKRSYTLGIEGISERQRAFLHKSLLTDDIVGLLRHLLGSKVREVKLFYILTGHEDEEDIAEFRQFLRDLKAMRRVRGARVRRGVRMVFSFGLLIRMPFTPLRYDRLLLDEEHWRPTIGQVKSACETNGFEFRLAFDWPAYCVTQVLALGGYWLIEAILGLARDGYCFDTELPPGYWDALQARMVRKGHWNEAFLGEKGPDTPFALDFVRSNVPPQFLYRQYQEAREGRDGGYCLGSQDKEGRCLACGACASAERRSAITGQRAPTSDAGAHVASLREVMAHKRQLKPVYVRVRLDRRLAGALPAYLNAYAFRELLARHPELAENLLSARESLFTRSPNDRRFPPLTGETVFALKAWDVEAMMGILGCSRTSPPALVGRAHDLGSTTTTMGLEVIGLAEGFTPGTFTRIQLEIHLPDRHFPEPRRNLETYLREAYLPYLLRREEPLQGGEARYRFDVPSKGLRKKILYSGAFEIGARGMDAWLEVGPGFDLLALLEGFGGRNLYRQAGVHVTRVEW